MSLVDKQTFKNKVRASGNITYTDEQLDQMYDEMTSSLLNMDEAVNGASTINPTSNLTFGTRDGAPIDPLSLPDLTAGLPGDEYGGGFSRNTLQFLGQGLW